MLMTGSERKRRDRRIVERLREGDREAFDRFFDDNAPGLYRFALARVGFDPELAKEIVQTTLCNALAGIDGYRGEASLFTWLSTCCVYEISRRARNRARRPVEVPLDEERAVAAERSRAEPSPESRASASQMRDLVHTTLDRLPHDYAAVLEWKYLDELPVREIAARLGVSAKAAESKLTRARAAFRSRFESVASEPGLWRRLLRRPSEGARRP